MHLLQYIYIYTCIYIYIYMGTISHSCHSWHSWMVLPSAPNSVQSCVASVRILSWTLGKKTDDCKTSKRTIRNISDYYCQ